MTTNNSEAAERRKPLFAFIGCMYGCMFAYVCRLFVLFMRGNAHLRQTREIMVTNEIAMKVKNINASRKGCGAMNTYERQEHSDEGDET